jgi:hypothetical protein
MTQPIRRSLRTKFWPLGQRVTWALAAGLMGPPALASSASGTPSLVTPNTVWMYSSFGTGDVVFRQNASGLSQCFGFWLRPTDPGFKTNVAALLIATQTQSTITVSVDDSQLWTGSGSPYCLVVAVGF